MDGTCISDTHGYFPPLPAGDLLIHAGDSLHSNTFFGVEKLKSWFDTLKFKHKILIAGNHDFIFQDYKEECKEILQDSVIYLHDSSTIIEGFKIYGSPYTPAYNNWAFNLQPEELKEKWSLIPGDTDILVTHGPPVIVTGKHRF